MRIISIKEKIIRLTDSFFRFDPVGLDISDRSMKYLKFIQAKKGMVFDVFGEIAIPEGVIEDGEIKKEPELIQVFHDWLSGEGRHVRGSFVNVSLPEEKSFVRLIQLPKIKQEAVGNAIRWEIEANVPIPLEDLIFDYEVIEPVENHIDHIDVVITAFPKVIVESYVRVFKAVGLEPLALELESQAIARSVLSNLRDPAARVIVDMGRNRTSFILVGGGAITYTATIELGGRILEQNLMKELSISQERATAIKKNIGLNKREQKGQVFQVLLFTLSVLADELRRVIEYHRAHADHAHGVSKEVAELLLAGGESNLYGLDTYLSSSLKVPVRMADPFASIRNELKVSIPPISKSESLAFATAIGLAVRRL